MHIIIAPDGRRIFVAKVSAQSNNDFPQKVRMLPGQSDNEHNALSRNSGIMTIRQAFVLLKLNLSRKNAIVTSAIDIVDVSAATSSNRKNRVDHILPPSILWKTSGNVTKTSVAPSKV